MKKKKLRTATTVFLQAETNTVLVFVDPNNQL